MIFRATLSVLIREDHMRLLGMCACVCVRACACVRACKLTWLCHWRKHNVMEASFKKNIFHHIAEGKAGVFLSSNNYTLAQTIAPTSCNVVSRVLRTNICKRLAKLILLPHKATAFKRFSPEANTQAIITCLLAPIVVTSCLCVDAE